MTNPLKQALEEFINTLDLSGFGKPTCETVHPHVTNALMDLERSADWKDLWTKRLTPLQQVERHCLANELKVSLQAYMKEKEYRAIEPELQHILLIAISAAWLVHEKVTQEMGGESE